MDIILYKAKKLFFKLNSKGSASLKLVQNLYKGYYPSNQYNLTANQIILRSCPFVLSHSIFNLISSIHVMCMNLGWSVGVCILLLYETIAIAWKYSVNLHYFYL